MHSTHHPTTIYVRLLDEGIDVWRPVLAVALSETTYHLIEQAYDSAIETWEFQPGDTVTCKTSIIDHETRMIAVGVAASI